MNKTQQLTRLGLLGAIAFVLMYFDFALPLLFPAFLKLDFGDVPALIAAFSMGPLAGVAVQFIKVALYALLKGGSAGPIGWLANFLAGASLVATAGWFHKHHRGLKGHLFALLAGTLAMAGVMLVLNTFVLMPLYTGLDRAASFQLALAGATPFNLFKGGVVILAGFAAHRRLVLTGGVPARP